MENDAFLSQPCVLRSPYPMIMPLEAWRSSGVGAPSVQLGGIGRPHNGNLPPIGGALGQASSDLTWLALLLVGAGSLPPGSRSTTATLSEPDVGRVSVCRPVFRCSSRCRLHCAARGSTRSWTTRQHQPITRPVFPSKAGGRFEHGRHKPLPFARGLRA